MQRTKIGGQHQLRTTISVTSLLQLQLQVCNNFTSNSYFWFSTTNVHTSKKKNPIINNTKANTQQQQQTNLFTIQLKNLNQTTNIPESPDLKTFNWNIKPNPQHHHPNTQNIETQLKIKKQQLDLKFWISRNWVLKKKVQV